MLPIRRFAQKPLERQLRLTTATVEAAVPEISIEAYAPPLRWLHAVMAVGAVSCVGLVKMAQYETDNKKKGNLMFYHKSTGLLMLPLIALRTALALKSRAPAPLPGTSLTQIGATISHKGMYAMLWFLPLSGVAMGYYGGRGLPFYFTTIPGKAEADTSISKPAWKYHKLVGQALEVFIPLHLLGSAYHLAKGQKILSRMNPFA